MRTIQLSNSEALVILSKDRHGEDKVYLFRPENWNISLKKEIPASVVELTLNQTKEGSEK
jgi:hypothetical protein